MGTEERKPMNIVESIKYVNDLMINSNENEMHIFFHLAAINVSESWKNPEFYEGAPHLKRFMDKKFSALMIEVFRKTTMWFRSMEGILGLPDGKELLLKHGRENMVAYMGFADTEQVLVLKMAIENPIATFHSLLKAAGLKGKQNPDNEENKKSVWKAKYLDEVRKNKRLQKKCDKQRKHIEDLKATIRNMMRVAPTKSIENEERAH